MQNKKGATANTRRAKYDEGGGGGYRKSMQISRTKQQQKLQSDI